MKTIEINTTQNVTIEYELAFLRERALAFLIDAVLVGVVCIFLSYIFEGGFTTLFYSMDAFQLYIVLPYCVFVFYQLFIEVIKDGQSIGKQAVGIKVVRLDGKEAGFSEFLFRATFHILDVLFSFGILGAILISSSDKGQRLGDMTANTTVIRVRFSLRFRLEDILKINSLEDYEPSFPQVRKLSEKDMLLIKSIITRNRLYQNQAHQEVVDDLVIRLKEELSIDEIKGTKIDFLKTLIRDYIVLTR